MSYVAIDPPAVADLARALDAAADALDTRRVAVDRTLRSVGRAATAPARLGAAATSLRDSGGDLRRRLSELAKLQVLYRHMGEPGTVYPRPDTTFRTFAEATAAGDELGREFASLGADGDDCYDPDRVAPLLAQLADHDEDAHFTAAFFRAMTPLEGVRWVLLFRDLTRNFDFPYDHDGAMAPYLTALGTALDSDPALLRAYVKPLQGMLLPAETRDVLRYGDYDDATVLTLVRAAVEQHLQGVHGMNWWEDEPGLLDAVTRSPELAQRFIAGLPDDQLRDLLGTSDGLVSGFGSVAYVAGYGADEASYAAVERLVVALGHGARLADEVQFGVASAMGAHLDRLALMVTEGAYPPDFSKDQLVSAFVRVMDGNRDAYVTVHDAAADLTARLLAVHDNLSRSSPALAALGAVHGLVASADADADVAAGARSAGYWAMASQALSLVPLPGPALAGTVVKKTFGSLLDDQADAARAAGKAKATIDFDTGYDQGRQLIAVALWQQDAAVHGAASTLAPPALLRHPDGTLKVLAELRTPAERAALDEWLGRPVPWTVESYDGTAHRATLDELTRSIDDEYDAAFKKVLMGR